MTIGEIGTVYACIVATTSLVWNIVRGSLDARKAILSAELQYTVEIDADKKQQYTVPLANNVLPRLPQSEKSFKIKCSNTGRRPLTIESWGVLTRTSPTSAQQTRNQLSPRPTLEESESFSFEITDFDVLRGNVVAINVLDTHGKHWQLPEEQLKIMRELMLEYRL